MTSLSQGQAGPRRPAVAPLRVKACTAGACAARALAAFAVAAALGCGHDSPGKPQAKDAAQAPPTPVSLSPVLQKVWPKTVRVQGSLHADQETVVAAKVAGRVIRALVDIGTEVRQGQLVAEMETQEFELRVKLAEAQLGQARAALGLAPDAPDSSLDRLKAPPVVLERSLVEEARAAFDRAQMLFDRKVMGAEELEQKRALLQVAQSRYQSALNSVDEKISLIRVRRVELEVAKQTLVDAEMRAPYDGLVQARTVDDGSYVRIGDPVATLVRTDPLRFRASVPERQAKLVRIGQKVEIFIEGVAERIEATVDRTSPMLDLASRSLTIEATIANPDGRLRSGWFAEADVVVAPDASAVAVSSKAISEFAGVEKVYVVKDGVSKEQRVVTGRRRGDLVEILSGLKAGQSVVDDGPAGVVGKVLVKESAQLVSRPDGEAAAPTKAAVPPATAPAPAGKREAVAAQPGADAAQNKHAATGE